MTSLVCAVVVAGLSGGVDIIEFFKLAVNLRLWIK